MFFEVPDEKSNKCGPWNKRKNEVSSFCKENELKLIINQYQKNSKS